METRQDQWAAVLLLLAGRRTERLEGRREVGVRGRREKVRRRGKSNEMKIELDRHVDSFSVNTDGDHRGFGGCLPEESAPSWVVEELPSTKLPLKHRTKTEVKAGGSQTRMWPAMSRLSLELLSPFPSFQVRFLCSAVNYWAGCRGRRSLLLWEKESE